MANTTPTVVEYAINRLADLGIDRVFGVPGEQSHFTTPGVSKPFYLSWIKDRVAGKPLANACPQH